MVFSVFSKTRTKQTLSFLPISFKRTSYHCDTQIKIILNDKPVNLIWFVPSTSFSSIHGLLEILPSRIQLMHRIVTRLQSFNTRRKLCVAAIASVWSSTMFLRTKKLKTLVGSHDLTQRNLEQLFQTKQVLISLVFIYISTVPVLINMYFPFSNRVINLSLEKLYSTLQNQ